MRKHVLTNERCDFSARNAAASRTNLLHLLVLGVQSGRDILQLGVFALDGFLQTAVVLQQLGAFGVELGADFSQFGLRADQRLLLLHQLALPIGQLAFQLLHRIGAPLHPNNTHVYTTLNPQ